MESVAVSEVPGKSFGGNKKYTCKLKTDKKGIKLLNNLWICPQGTNFFIKISYAAQTLCKLRVCEISGLNECFEKVIHMSRKAELMTAYLTIKLPRLVFHR